MIPLTVTFDLPARILTGLANGTLVRNGGVIQDTSGRVVMWLREMEIAATTTGFGPTVPMVDPITGALNLVMQGANMHISMRGFAAVTQQLTQVQNMVNLTTAGSILSLSVSVIGFAVMSKKLGELEKKLSTIQKSLEKIDKKIDLSFYANFRAALDLAQNAFSMQNTANRRSCALQAINRFLEAEHIYTDLVVGELAEQGRISREYLLTLCLAYIAEARCYLELDEYDTAIRRFQEGQDQVNEHIEKYIDSLLTSSPLMYLLPKFSGEIDLARLTRIYQWKDPTHTENSVFELLRYKIVPERDMLWSSQIDKWIETLPPFFVGEQKPKKSLLGEFKKETREKNLRKLPEALKEMEMMLETNKRFAGYKIEAKVLKTLGISFQDWMELQPSEAQQNKHNIMCIIPKERLVLEGC